MEPIKEIQEKEENEDPSDGTTKCILNASKICFGDYQVKYDKHLRIELKSKSIFIKEVPSYKADNWEGKQLKFKVLIFSKDITEAHYSISDDKIFLFINVSVSFAQDIQEKLQLKKKIFHDEYIATIEYSDSIIVEAIIIDPLNTQNFMEKWLDKRAIDIPTASVEQFKCNMASLKRRMCKHPLSKSIVREYKTDGNAAVENNCSQNHMIKCNDVLFGTCLMQKSKQILIELKPKALKFCRIPFIKHDPKRISARFNIHISMKDILEACYSVDDESGLVFLKIGIVLAESIAKELALKDNLFPKVYCAKNENPRWIVARFKIKEMAVFEEHIKNEEFICFKCITPKEAMNLLEANCHNDERLASSSLIRCSGASCNTQEFGTKTSLSAENVFFGTYNCNEKNRKIEIDLYKKYIVFKDIPCKSASKDSSENVQTYEIIIGKNDILEAYFTQLDENNVIFLIRVGFKFARNIEEKLLLCKNILRAESGAKNEKTRFIKAYLEDSTAFFQHLQRKNEENDDFIHFEEIQCAKKVKEMITNDEQQGVIETVSESFIQKCSSTTCIDSSKSLAQLENVSPSSKNIKKNLIVAKEVHFGSYKCPKEGITIEIKPDQMVLQRVTSSQKLDINGKLKEFEIIIDKCDIGEAYYAQNNNGAILLMLRLSLSFTQEIEDRLQLEKMILQDPSGVEKDRPRFIRIDICDDESKTIEAIQEIFYEKLDYENCSQLLQEDVEFELLVSNTDQDTEVSCISECI